jgi:hypothetical protein
MSMLDAYLHLTSVRITTGARRTARPSDFLERPLAVPLDVFYGLDPTRWRHERCLLHFRADHIALPHS